MADVLTRAKDLQLREAREKIVYIRLDFLQEMITEIEALRADRRPLRAVAEIADARARNTREAAP